MAGEAKEIMQFAALMAIAPELVQKETANGINRAAYILQRQTMRNTPVKTSTLRKGWFVEKATPTSFKAIMGSAVPYAVPVEFGSGPHVIRARNKKALAFSWDGKWITVRSVNHPGSKGRFMLRDAITATQDERQKAYEDIPANVVKALRAGKR